MSEAAPLTSEQIVDAAEDVLRRFGPAKATVIDVARELGVSHGSIYRHFASKAALRDAVAARQVHGPSHDAGIAGVEPTGHIGGRNQRHERLVLPQRPGAVGLPQV